MDRTHAVHGAISIVLGKVRARISGLILFQKLFQQQLIRGFLLKHMKFNNKNCNGHTFTLMFTRKSTQMIVSVTGRMRPR